jgi:hypothetical protein
MAAASAPAPAAHASRDRRLKRSARSTAKAVSSIAP